MHIHGVFKAQYEFSYSWNYNQTMYFPSCFVISILNEHIAVWHFNWSEKAMLVMYSVTCSHQPDHPKSLKKDWGDQIQVNALTQLICWKAISQSATKMGFINNSWILGIISGHHWAIRKLYIAPFYSTTH